MKLSDLVERALPDSEHGTLEGTVLGVTCDSRRVRPGFVFVAVHGARLNGSDYAEDAAGRGAIAVVAESSMDSLRLKIPVVKVKEARKASAKLAAEFFGHPSRSLRVLGVTGTNGKTTTSFMIRDILKAKGMAPGMIGTVHYELGERTIPAARTTPEATELQGLLAQIRDAGCKSVVMEVSSHSVVQSRVHGVEFDCGVFTNLTHDHLDYHGSEEEYFKAKASFFLHLNCGQDPVAILNLDDPWGRKLAEMDEIKSRKITFGEAGNADVRATGLCVSCVDNVFKVVSPWGETEVRLKLPGRFNVSNALGAIATCGSMGVEPEIMARALASMEPVPGRLDHISTERGFDVFVDYAHTADALQNVLVTLRELTSRDLVVVFGCGGDRDRRKRPLMGKAAVELADRVVITSDNPRSEDTSAIIADILEGISDNSRLNVVEDRRSAIELALGNASEGDVVLVAGKGHENYQDLGNRVIPFDDKQVVTEFLARTK